MLKVLFVLESFLPQNKGGTEIYVSNLAKNIRNQHFTVEILISTTDESLADYSYDGDAIHTFKISAKPTLKELNGLIPPSGFLSFQNKVSKIAPHIVHFHSFGRAINSYHLKWVKEQGIKTVFTTHLGGFFCIKGNFLLYEKEICDGRIIESRCLNCHYQSKGISAILSEIISKLITKSPTFLRKIYPPQTNLANLRINELNRLQAYCDAIIAISPWIKKTFILNGIRERLYLVRQGIFIDDNKLSVLPKETGYPIKLGFIGRVYPVKGFHILASALEKIDSTLFELHVFTMPGNVEIEYYNKWQSWAGEKENIFWNENMSQEELFVEMQSLDLVINASLTEVAPLSILEAFALKIPVLGSSIPAIQDIIEDNTNGRIFRANDIQDIASKIQEVIDNPEKLKNWSKNIGSVRTSADVAEDMIEIYENLL